MRWRRRACQIEYVALLPSLKIKLVLVGKAKGLTVPLEVEPRSLEKRKKHWVGTGNGLRTRINIKAHHTNSFGLFGIAIAFALAFILRIRYIWLRLRVGKTPNYALRCMDRVWCNFLTYRALTGLGPYFILTT